MPDALLLFWRVGRKVGTNIYAQVGAEPSEDDIFLGCLDPQDLDLAQHVVRAHNVYRRAVEQYVPARRR